jgi:hypothetical protein
MWTRDLVGDTRFLSRVARELWNRHLHRARP